jgi:BirA family transcriptional regulator, biotin operon repressor / biotin---[acetyl-CoA-carboxylase] ligase
MTVATTWPARLERFESVESTNDVVMRWLENGHVPVCVAVADEQSAGRGRNGRTWMAPRGAALLCSLGFRPIYLEPSRLWQLAAIVSLAMADAVEDVSGVPAGTVRLKWPNDLVVVQGDAVRKLAGLLGETVGAGTDDVRVVIGIGVNAGWARDDFPPDLADSMTSVAELAVAAAAASSSRTPRDLRDDLLDAFLERLQPRVTDMSSNRFPAGEWRARQLTNGTVVRLERPDGSAELVRAIDVDADSGALVIDSLSGEWPARSVTVGEISHLRLAGV